jgi:hypothetical protein
MDMDEEETMPRQGKIDRRVGRLAAFVAIAALTVLGGCGDPASRGWRDKAQIAGESSGGRVQIAGQGLPKETVALDGELFLGVAIHVENVTVWPVYSRTRAEALIGGDLITLAEAQGRGWAVVREIGATVQVAGNAMPHLSEVSGTVNELVIENRGPRPILVLAGTLLKGGKQDRQVGQDFVVPAGKTVAVDAFCVEQGRWSAMRDGAATQGVFEAQQALATTAVRSSGQYKQDQGEVWANVAAENHKAGKAPSSGTFFATLEDADRSGRVRRERFTITIKTELGRLLVQHHPPVGLAYAVDGQVREVRAFTHPRVFERFLDTLVGTIAIEGDLAQRAAMNEGRAVHDDVAATDQVTDLVRETSKVTAQKKRNKAGNVNAVRKSRKVWNSDCFADEDQAAPVTRSFMYAH